MEQTITGFHHVAIKTHDLNRSLKFYIEGLGFTERLRWGTPDRPTILLVSGGNTYLELFLGGPADPLPEGPICHFALRTDDTDAAVKKAVAAGAVVTVPPKQVIAQTTTAGPMPIRLAFCKGPDGETIEFFQNEMT
jgi:glyoxylase I family protein